MSHPKKEFSQKYIQRIDPNNLTWRFLRWFNFILSFHRCALFPWLKAQQLDHLKYNHLGWELPVIDVVPLNEKTHRMVTFLRDEGFRGPINLILRLCYSCYISIWLVIGLFIIKVLGIYPWLPWPNQILAYCKHAIYAFTHILSPLWH